MQNDSCGEVSRVAVHVERHAVLGNRNLALESQTAVALRGQLRCVCVSGTKAERRMRDGSLRTDSKDVGTASWLLNDRSRRLGLGLCAVALLRRSLTHNVALVWFGLVWSLCCRRRTGLKPPEMVELPSSKG